MRLYLPPVQCDCGKRYWTWAGFDRCMGSHLANAFGESCYIWGEPDCNAACCKPPQGIVARDYSREWPS
jgi:hypothetical protein